MAIDVSKIAIGLRGVLECQNAASLTDAHLWERYVQSRDHAAFETLVKRHGPMVFRVCRRVLRNEQDAEDAFQATFLVFIRRAPGIQSPDTIASWLHGVAYRTSLQARTSAAKRRVKEEAAAHRADVPEDPAAELWPVLEQELTRLNEHYRAAVILCDVEGKTRKEAAQQLGWAEGTVASRLARGRDILARRLARRGFAGGLLALAVAAGTAAASVAVGRLCKIVIGSCITLECGDSIQSHLSPRVISLSEGVVKSMVVTKFKSALAAIVVLAIAALGAGTLISNGQATENAGTSGLQDKGKASPDDLRRQLQDLKQQNQQMQKTIDKMTEDLERETPPGEKERNPRNANDTSSANLFKHKVKFEIGFSEYRDGGMIEIREVWGTRPKIEVGGQYLVHGKYKLPKGQHGKLYFYATAGGDWGRASLATLDLQMATADQQEGEFTLVHGMAGEGWFHLVLTDPEKYSDMFANVYFGTGDSVLRRKP